MTYERWKQGIRKAPLFVLAVIVALSVPAGASTLVSGISVDADLTDWGVATPTTTNGNNWAPTQGAWTSEDWVGAGGIVGPGGGGQDFDVEALYTGFDTTTNTLYVALVTGFDIGGELGGTYLPGDIFIDFGQDSTWDLAFDISSWGGGGDSDIDAIYGPGLTYTSTPSGVGGYSSGPFAATGPNTDVNGVSFAYDDNGPAAWNQSLDHNVYEFSYQITNAAWLAEIYNGGNGLTTHWTMNCGNDVLDLPVAPVPVPSAAFLGILGGLAVVVKRRFAA